MVVIVSGNLVGTGMIVDSRSQVVWGLVLPIINVVVFEGVLDIHTVLRNPLKMAATHFPVTNYVAGLLASTGAVAAGRDHLPQAVTK